MQRLLLWQRRRDIVHPFNETAMEVFARISALRDRLDGPPVRTASSSWPLLTWKLARVFCALLLLQLIYRPIYAR